MSGSNPDQLWNLVPNGPVPMTGQENFLAAQTASPTASVLRYSLNDILHDIRADTGIDVDTFGAKGDRKEYFGTLTVAAGINPTLTIAGADLSTVSIGQLVVLPLGGAAGAGVKATVASVIAATSQIQLTGTVTTALAGIAFQATGNPTIGAAGTGVSPLDVYTLVGGTAAVAAQVTIQTTKVISATLNTAGSGGVDGVYTFTGTSPAAVNFKITGTITGGVLASIVATPTTAGVYQANPPALGQEPIVDVNGVSGLVGATVTLVMGANNTLIQAQPGSPGSIMVPGGYSTIPSNPVATTGPGTGVTLNITWTAPRVVIGTDSAPAINAAVTALRALGRLNGARSEVDNKLIFTPNADYLVNDSLNFTELARLIIDGQRARIHSVASGLPVFDELGSQLVANLNLTITGDETFPPRWCFQYGTTTNSETAAYMAFDGIVIFGTFTDAGFDYNSGAETITTGLVRGVFVAPYSRIEDAAHSSVWNVTSKYTPITVTPDVAKTFIGGAATGGVSLVNQHPSGCGVWMLGGTNHNYGQGSYLFCWQAAFLIIASTLAQPSGLVVYCHVEGARNVFGFLLPVAHAQPLLQLNRIRFNDSLVACTEYIFGLGAPAPPAGNGLISLRLFNTEITAAFTSPTARYFDDPGRVTFSGKVLGGDGATKRWTSNVPNDTTGLITLLGAVDPFAFLYNTGLVGDTLVDGNLSVAGIMQAGAVVNVTDGTVASVGLTRGRGGAYNNPDYPTYTIDPPLSGVTALATVTGMVWDGTGAIVAPGTGYLIGDLLTFVGGTFTTAATMHVSAINGSGGVTAFLPFGGGKYSAYPPLGATTTTGGSGTGCVMSPALFSVAIDGVTVTNPGNGYTTFPNGVFSLPLNGRTAARGTPVMGVSTGMDAHGGHFYKGIDATLATKTGTSYSVTESDYALVLNPSGAFTLTLLAEGSYPGRLLNMKLIANQTVASATANVVPLAGGSAGTAILAGTAGKWCMLQSDGTAWQIMAAN